MISIPGSGIWIKWGDNRWGGMNRDFIYLFIYFCNRFFWLFVQFFTIIIIKCKASFSYHSSSSHYSTQGFVLILFHFIFSFLKNKKNKILCNFTCDLLLCLQISDLKCGQACGKNMTKNSQVNGSLRENVSVFWIIPSCFNKQRNVGMRGHLRKEIVLLKYQFFRFRTKSGGQFELLN